MGLLAAHPLMMLLYGHQQKITILSIEQDTTFYVITVQCNDIACLSMLMLNLHTKP